MQVALHHSEALVYKQHVTSDAAVLGALCSLLRYISIYFQFLMILLTRQNHQVAGGIWKSI